VESQPITNVLASKRVQVAFICVLSVLVALVPRFEQSPAQWPSGDIELIIPSGPGGGFDAYARVLARAMEAGLDVRVIPKNTPGGDGRRGATAAFNAVPDGRTFAIFNLPGVIEPEITGERAGYSIAEIDWLGALAFGQYIVVAPADSRFDTLEDFKQAGRVISFTAYGSSGIAANKVLCAEVGLECQIITGYPSNNEALVGIVRGDADASVLPISTAVSFNTNGDLKGILLMTDRPVPAYAGTQNTFTAGYPVLAELGLLRAFGLPPGVSPEIRQGFATVFDAALTARSVSDWAVSSGAEFSPMNADELRARIQSQRALLSHYRDVIAAAP